MKKPSITQAMIDRALARTASAPCYVNQGKGRRIIYRSGADKRGFIKYPRGTIVFKKMRGGSVLALYVPRDQCVFKGRAALTEVDADHTKCRTRLVYVVGRVFGKEVRAIRSSYQGPFWDGKGYKAGQWSEADGFSKDARKCAQGVHFFETVAEARRFNR